jgi:predicted alpha/beta hydrolase family esterase
MKKVFIVHGLGSAPDHAWRGWLGKKLTEMGIHAELPQMPGGDDPICDKWVDLLKNITKKEDENYLIGHSLGARAVLKFLESGGEAKGVIIVSGRFGSPKSDILHSFYDNPLNFKKIKESAKFFAVFHGDNDPNIPFEDGQKIAENLECKFIPIIGGGHLSGKAGWNEFPEVLEELLKIMNN